MLIALHNLLGKLRLLGLGRIFVTESVALLVGLSTDIEPVLIAEVVPLRVIGIVAGTHGINVETFHNLDIFNHPIPTYYISAVGIHLVSVGSFDKYGLTVD